MAYGGLNGVRMSASTNGGLDGLLAIHWVWSTYGSWLPCDSRAHWSPLFDLYGRIRQRGGTLNLPDTLSTAVAQNNLQSAPVVLSGDDVTIVAHTIGKLVQRSANDGKPTVYAAAIETNHVHLLTSPPCEAFGAFIGRLKGTSSSAVVERFPERSRTWAAGYWKVYLESDDAVAAVRAYIENHNTRKGLAPKPYDWIV
jgi:REP element-mobilizing transposase RayT